MIQYSTVDRVFFEIPVYRCSFDAHSAEMESDKQRLIGHLSREDTPQTYDAMLHYFDTKVWYSWKYNEIVGWITLAVISSQFRAELWWNRATRQVRHAARHSSLGEKCSSWTF